MGGGYGTAPGGHPVWTDREIALLAVIFPDYKRAVAVVQRRTYSAVRGRARSMGLTDCRHVWTGAEVSRLRRLFPTADKEMLTAAFPGIPLHKVYAKARHIGVHRKRRQFKPTGIPSIDQIRGRAFQLNVSMVDLDAMAKTNCYFQKGNWHTGNINYKAIGRATEALDGLLAVRWKDQV